MTELEQKIIDALQNTKKGREFVEKWEWEIDDWLLKNNCYLGKIINKQGDALSLALYNSNKSFLGFGFDDCTVVIHKDKIIPIPNETQMRNALEQAGYDDVRTFKDGDKYFCWIIKAGGWVEYKKEGKTRLEAVQNRRFDDGSNI